MGMGDAAKAAMRVSYRLARAPVHFIDDAVLPAFFDDDATVRLAYGDLLVGCDRVAAHLLGDTTAALRADLLRDRNTTTRYAIARRQYRSITRADAVLAGHRARFEQRWRPSLPETATVVCVDAIARSLPARSAQVTYRDVPAPEAATP